MSSAANLAIFPATFLKIHFIDVQVYDDRHREGILLFVMTPPQDSQEMSVNFKLMVDHAPIGILSVDALGNIIHVNPKAESIFGYAQSELLGQSIETLLPAAIRERHVQYRAGFVAAPAPRPMGQDRHLYGRHKTGREIPVEIGLVPIKTPEGMTVLASIVDMTVAKKSAESLSQFAAIVQASEDAIITLTPDDKILTWNPGAEKVYGYTAAEIIGKEVMLLIPSDREQEFMATREKIHRNEAIRQLETVRLRKDGRSLHVLLSISPLVNAEGVLVGAATITHDITEKKRMEQELLHAAEMEQKRIAQDLHDSLGQQLLAISFLCNILKKKLGAGTTPDVSEAAHIEDLLNEAKMDLRRLTRGLYAADLESRGIGTSLKDLVDHVQESSTIDCSFKGDDTLMLSDRAQSENLYRLSQEALNNAVKHSFAKHITVSISRTGSHVLLTVKDDGIGLPDLTSHVSGLGLRTMRYRANVIGGTFDVRREDEGGTIVSCSVYIP